MSDLQGKVMVITGASAGIGAALAQAAAARGARLVLAARRAERLAQAAAGLGSEVLTVTADVTSARDQARLKEATLARFGRVDVLVNNAGAGAYGLFLESTEAQWRALFEVDLFAPLALTQAFLPVLLAQGQGLIVNVASVAGLMAHAPKVALYVAAKHALVGFSRGLAKDLAGTGVRVRVACPFLTATEFFDHGPGAAEMAAETAGLKGRLDSAEAVAEGILDQLADGGLLLFPTPRAAQAYQKMREA